jgi:hypothetical protein
VTLRGPGYCLDMEIRMVAQKALETFFVVLLVVLMVDQRPFPAPRVPSGLSVASTVASTPGVRELVIGLFDWGLPER